MNLSEKDISNFMTKGYIVYKMIYERYGDHGDFPILKKWWSRFSDCNDTLQLPNVDNNVIDLFNCCCKEMKCALSCNSDSIYNMDINKRLSALQAILK